MANFIARDILYDLGVETEWLVKGVSAYGAGRLTGVSPASELRGLLSLINNEALPSLESLEPDYRLNEDSFDDASVQAWDIVRFLAENYGLEAVAQIVGNVAQGMSPDAAVSDVTGQPLAAIEAEWLASATQAHIQPEWISIAESFDIEAVEAHMDALTSPEMNGRQVGSPGSELAAEYIAGKFEEYGLQPVGSNDSYFQSFGIDYVAWESAPAMEVTNGDGDLLSLRFRQEFVVPVTITQSSEVVSGELVYVFDPTYEGLDLTGKVAVRYIEVGSIGDEAARAYDHGAAGLIIATGLDFEKDIVAKQPLPIQISETLTIPVMMLTRPGFDMLLEMAAWTRIDVNNSPPARPMGLTVRMQLPLSEPEPVEIANVLGMLPGSDPNLRDEYVIIGAHYDHVGHDPDLLLCDGRFVSSTAEFDESTCERVPGMPYTGLVDNASGVAAILDSTSL
jgi:hypothetical protein